MVVGQVKHRSGVTGIENSLKEDGCVTATTEFGTFSYQEGATKWKVFDKDIVELLRATLGMGTSHS